MEKAIGAAVGLALFAVLVLAFLGDPLARTTMLGGAFIITVVGAAYLIYRLIGELGH